MSILVYHGGTESIAAPNCSLGRMDLDFGQGFYLTAIRQQACNWATVTALRRHKSPVLNIYRLDRDAIIAEARCRIFKEYDKDWLDFIVASRNGKNPAGDYDYDYIEGGVANDRVIDTVNLYMTGLMSADVALARLAQHLPNNQICLLNQSLTDKYLTYEGCEPVG